MLSRIAEQRRHLQHPEVRMLLLRQRARSGRLRCEASTKVFVMLLVCWHMANAVWFNFIDFFRNRIANGFDFDLYNEQWENVIYESKANIRLQIKYITMYQQDSGVHFQWLSNCGWATCPSKPCDKALASPKIVLKTSELLFRRNISVSNSPSKSKNPVSWPNCYCYYFRLLAL